MVPLSVNYWLSNLVPRRSHRPGVTAPHWYVVGNPLSSCIPLPSLLRPSIPSCLSSPLTSTEKSCFFPNSGSAPPVYIESNPGSGSFSYSSSKSSLSTCFRLDAGQARDTRTQAYLSCFLGAHNPELPKPYSTSRRSCPSSCCQGLPIVPHLLLAIAPSLFSFLLLFRKFHLLSVSWISVLIGSHHLLC